MRPWAGKAWLFLCTPLILLIPLLVPAQVVHLGENAQLRILDEGVEISDIVSSFDCVGSNVTCSIDPGDETVIQFDMSAAGSGDVTGPGSAVDHAVVRWDGTAGTLVQNSVAILDDVGSLSGLLNVTLSGTVDGRDVATDGTKLDTIATNADDHPLVDTETIIKGSVDPTKLVRFEADLNLTTGVTRVINMADQNIDLTPNTDLAAAVHAGRHTDGTDDVSWLDNEELILGTGGDTTIDHTGTETLILHTTGPLHWDNTDVDDGYLFDLGTTTSATAFAVRKDSLANILEIDGSGLSTFTGDLVVDGNVSPTGTVDGRFVSTDGTKLDGVEAGAQVTNATRVNAAGAVMHIDIPTAEGVLTKTGAETYTAIKTNIGASTAPTVNDDSGDGYVVASLWLDTTADKAYRAVDVTVGAAVWKEITAGAGAGGDVSRSGSTTDNKITRWHLTGADVQTSNVEITDAGDVQFVNSLTVDELSSQPADPTSGDVKLYATDQGIPNVINDLGAAFPVSPFTQHPSHQFGYVTAATNDNTMNATGLLERSQYANSTSETLSNTAGRYFRSETKGTVGKLALWNSRQIFSMESRPQLVLKFRVGSSVADVRLFAGYADDKDNFIKDLNGAGKAIGLSLDDGASTAFRFMVDDGTTQTFEATSVTAAADTVYYLLVEHNASASVVMRIYDSRFNELDNHEFTANLPTFNSDLYFVEAGIETQAAAVKAIDIYYAKALIRGLD